jgi:hypothetical protein
MTAKKNLYRILVRKSRWVVNAKIELLRKCIDLCRRYILFYDIKDWRALVKKFTPKFAKHEIFVISWFSQENSAPGSKLYLTLINFFTLFVLLVWSINPTPNYVCWKNVLQEKQRAASCKDVTRKCFEVARDQDTLVFLKFPQVIITVTPVLLLHVAQ